MKIPSDEPDGPAAPVVPQPPAWQTFHLANFSGEDTISELCQTQYSDTLKAVASGRIPDVNGQIGDTLCSGINSTAVRLASVSSLLSTDFNDIDVRFCQFYTVPHPKPPRPSPLRPITLLYKGLIFYWVLLCRKLECRSLILGTNILHYFLPTLLTKLRSTLILYLANILFCPFCKQLWFV